MTVDPRTLAAHVRAVMGDGSASTFIDSMVPLHDVWLRANPPCPTCGGFGATERPGEPIEPCADCPESPGIQPFDKWTAGLVALATQGCGLLVIERHRQISEEGWTPDHDDQHDDGVLVRAALCYADKAAVQAQGHRNVGDLRPVWPWGESWWKPSDDPIRNLVKAGALIAAEIDRLHRQIGGAR